MFFIGQWTWWWKASYWDCLSFALEFVLTYIKHSKGGTIIIFSTEATPKPSLSCVPSPTCYCSHVQHVSVRVCVEPKESCSNGKGERSQHLCCAENSHSSSPHTLSLSLSRTHIFSPHDAIVYPSSFSSTPPSEVSTQFTQLNFSAREHTLSTSQGQISAGPYVFITWLLHLLMD